MKIAEILTFTPNQGEPYDAHPLPLDRVDHDTLARISNALTGPEFVVDPVRLRPEVPWPGASVSDTDGMPAASPSIGRDTFYASSTNGAVQPGSAEHRRPMIPIRR